MENTASYRAELKAYRAECVIAALDGGRHPVDDLGVHLAKLERDLMILLWEANGRTVSLGAIMDALYGHRPDGNIPADNIVKVRLHHVRRKLAHTGTRIETVWGQGYRLIKHEPTEEPAMPTEPLATLKLHHATIEFWNDNVRTVFHEDQSRVPAAPNEGETIIDTAVHEALHSILAQVTQDRPSECLRAVADGDGRRWTQGRREEEAMAYGMGPLVVALHRALCEAYAPRDLRRPLPRATALERAAQSQRDPSS